MTQIKRIRKNFKSALLLIILSIYARNSFSQNIHSSLLTAHTPLVTAHRSLPQSSIINNHLSIDTLPYPFPNSIIKKRLIGTTVGTVSAYAGFMTATGFVWYQRQDLGKFHWFEDSGEWQQIDKTGHWFAPYMFTTYGYYMLRWSGMKNTPAALTAGAFGFLSLAIMEIPDGFSNKYGASWSDIVFDFGGAAFATAQFLAWKEQRILSKYSFTIVNYPRGELRTRAEELYGKNIVERMIKDYNGVALWFSVNLYSFNHNIRPKWLCVSVGYGAGNMYGGFENKWTDKDGVLHDRTDVKRYRRFFLSIDADLSKIETKTRVGKVLLGILNVVKIPAPAIEFNTLGQVVFHPMFALNLEYPIVLNRKK